MDKRGKSVLTRKHKLLLARLVLNEHGSINEARVEGCGKGICNFWIYDTLHRHHFLFKGSRDECDDYKSAFLSFYNHVKNRKEEYEIRKYRDAGIKIGEEE